MKIEVREDSVHITGYVNAIERYSKPIRESLKGQIRTFIERIKAGVFNTALKRNDDVKVLLNHNHERVLATTKDGSAKLEEDNIGLRAEVTITDKEVVEKARNGKLVGWSFGFYANSDELGTEGETETRTVTDLDLIEVSILDDTKSPAYYGTSIEARSEGEKMLEYRTAESSADVSAEDVEKSAENREEELNKFAELVADKVLEKLNGTREEKTIPEETLVEEEKGEERAEIDYSSFEERISKLK